MSLCHKLQAEGVARNCHVTTAPTSSPLSGAREAAEFDPVSGGTGRVYVLPSEEIFERVSEARRLAGEYNVANQYSNQGYRKAKAFVLLGDNATAEDERTTRRVLGQDN